MVRIRDRQKKQKGSKTRKGVRRCETLEDGDDSSSNSGAVWESEAIHAGSECPPLQLDSCTVKGEHCKVVLGKCDFWTIIVTLPGAFTFVCCTELLGFYTRRDDFAKRGCRVVALSADTHHTLAAWLKLPIEEGGPGIDPQGVATPGIPDQDVPDFFLTGDPLRLFDAPGSLWMPNGQASRNTYIVDPSGVVLSKSQSAGSVGRDVDEVLRSLDAWQFVVEKAAKGEEVLCPLGWRKDAPGILPSLASVAQHNIGVSTSTMRQ